MPGDTSTSGEGVGSQRRGWGRGQGGVEGRRVFNWKEARAAAQQGSRSERERVVLALLLASLQKVAAAQVSRCRKLSGRKGFC